MLSKRYEFDGKAILKLNSLQIEARGQVESKFKKGMYKFESFPCSICSNEDFEILSNKDRYGMQMNLVICLRCGLIQINPRMNQESYNTFYENEYRKLHRGKAAPSEDFFQHQYRYGQDEFRYVSESKVFSNISKPFVLEVGCGAGGILQVFKEKGWKVKGIDLGEEYLEYGNINHGLDLQKGAIKDVVLDEPPHLIVYSHVFEHITDLKAELENIHRLLDPNGFLYIEVPGVKDLMYYCEIDFLRSLQHAHVYYFTLTTLRNTLESNGFEFVKGDEVIRSIFKKSKSSSYSKKIENDYEAVMSFLNKIEKCGKFYIFTPYKIRVSIRKFLDFLGLLNIVKAIYRKIK